MTGIEPNKGVNEIKQQFEKLKEASQEKLPDSNSLSIFQNADDADPFSGGNGGHAYGSEIMAPTDPTSGTSNIDPTGSMLTDSTPTGGMEHPAGLFARSHEDDSDPFAGGNGVQIDASLMASLDPTSPTSGSRDIDPMPTGSTPTGDVPTGVTPTGR